MGNIVSIIVVLDQRSFIEEYEKNPSSTAMIPLDVLRDRVRMITVSSNVESNQASSDLSVYASPGDNVRWYESPIRPSPEYCLIIDDISPVSHQYSLWSQNMKNYNSGGEVDYCVTKTQQSMRAYNSRGELSSISSKVDYTEATVLDSATVGSELNYDIHFKLIKLVHGEPQVVRTYYYDPKIVIR